MSNNVTQWLAQIKSLKQQLADTIHEREAAEASAAKWRHLYNTEAQQRRTQTRLAQHHISTLKAQIQQLQREKNQLPSLEESVTPTIEQTVAKLKTVEQLRAKLTETLAERDRLLKALNLEKAKHLQTRKSLTAVIGDTIDQLTKQRQSNTSASQVNQSDRLEMPRKTP